VTVAGQVVADPMRAYYHRRAEEYDEWWLGTGSFAARERPGWADEVAELIALIRSLPPGRTLDVACGTGFLTQHLAGDVTGLDQSPAMISRAQECCPGFDFLCADAVPLPFEDDSFDVVFTSHFYGHLLPEERTQFLCEARRVGKRLVVIDAALRPDVKPEQWQERSLGDGSVHSVYKRYFTASELAEEIEGTTLHAGRWFVVADCQSEEVEPDHAVG